MSEPTDLAPLILTEQEPSAPYTFELLLYDGDMEQVEDAFHALNAEGHGHGWEGLAQSIVQTQMPEISDLVDFSSEAGTFVALSNERSVLQRLGLVLKSAFDDHALLSNLIREADGDLLPRGNSR